MSTRGKVCIYSEFLYPVLAGVDEFAGGAETQMAKMAHGLRDQGFDVSVVTCDYGQPESVRLDGIDVHRSFRREQGLPVLRFFHPRLTGAIRALNAADADVYYVNGAGMPAGLTHDVARWRGAGTVLHVASDYDVDPRGGRHNLRDRHWYLRALRDSDLILAQTTFQLEALRSGHGLASRILPNVVELPPRVADAGQDGPIVWLGTYKAIKRPEWFIELARALPARRFVMVGVVPPPPLTREHWDAACAAARTCPNLDVRGFLDHRLVSELFLGASLLVHTSPMEGFSNVMLESWAHGIPTLAAVDPDELLSKGGLGEHVTVFDDLRSAVERWMADPALRRSAGARARRYVEERHAPALVYEQLGRHLDEVVARVRSRRGR